VKIFEIGREKLVKVGCLYYLCNLIMRWCVRENAHITELTKENKINVKIKNGNIRENQAQVSATNHRDSGGFVSLYCGGCPNQQPKHLWRSFGGSQNW
jgi:hypothetical protein